MIKQLHSSNVVIYDITTSTLDDDLPRPPFIPRESIVLVTGSVPTWRYGMALSYLRKCPAAVIAFRDTETNLFRVVLSGDFDYPEGSIIKI
ncbi:MAG: CRISPR-associated protein Csx3 [Desulfitobacteriaceae bacterium]|nr:CRISPR-associated protein Csx3 [Desulfitobacteriaceae bacterium]